MGIHTIFFFLFLYRNIEPAHNNKTYNKTYVNSKDSDMLYMYNYVYIIQKINIETKDSDPPEHPPSMASVLGHLSLDSLEVVEGTCHQ